MIYMVNYNLILNIDGLWGPTLMGENNDFTENHSKKHVFNYLKQI